MGCPEDMPRVRGLGPQYHDAGGGNGDFSITWKFVTGTWPSNLAAYVKRMPKIPRIQLACLASNFPRRPSLNRETDTPKKSLGKMQARRRSH
eukprot:15483748-Alexandrium_andersonii.AAC.1